MFLSGRATVSASRATRPQILYHQHHSGKRLHGHWYFVFLTLRRVSTYRRLRTRSGKNFEGLMSNTAFNEYVALFFASDSVVCSFGPRCVKRQRRRKRAVNPLKGVVSDTVSRFCGIDWRSGCPISLEGLEGLSDTSRGRAELETRGLDSYTGVCFWMNTVRVSKLEVSCEDLQGQFQKHWRGFLCKAFARGETSNLPWRGKEFFKGFIPVSQASKALETWPRGPVGGFLFGS